MNKISCFLLCFVLFLSGCGEIHYTVETTINGNHVGTTDVTVKLAEPETHTPIPTSKNSKKDSIETEIQLSKMDSITITEYDDGNILTVVFLSGYDDDMKQIEYDNIYIYLLYNTIFPKLYDGFTGAVGGFVAGKTITVRFLQGEIESMDVPVEMLDLWSSYSVDELNEGLIEYSEIFNKISTTLGFGECF